MEDRQDGRNIDGIQTEERRVQRKDGSMEAWETTNQPYNFELANY